MLDFLHRGYFIHKAGLGLQNTQVIASVKKTSSVWRVQITGYSPSTGSNAYFVCVNALTGEVIDIDDEDFC